MDLGPRTQEVLHACLGRDERARMLWSREDPLDGFWDEEEDEFGPRHYGFDGEPVSMRVWSILHSAPERLLKQEWVRPFDSRKAYWLSTVWLGIDHNHARFLRDYPGETEIDTDPWIFETMLFAGEAGWRDVRWSTCYDDVGQWRFAKWEGALNFHNDLVTSMTAPPGIIPSYDD